MSFSLKNVRKEIKIGFFVILAAFIFSLVMFCIFSKGRRCVFYFNDLDTNKTACEIRYIPKNVPQGKIQYFIDELLLGPLNNRFQPLFSRNTFVKNCFERNGTLYLNISEEAVLENGNTMKVKDACKLLILNIEKNFGNIKKIELFIDDEVLNLD